MDRREGPSDAGTATDAGDLDTTGAAAGDIAAEKEAQERAADTESDAKE